MTHTIKHELLKHLKRRTWYTCTKKQSSTQRSYRPSWAISRQLAIACRRIDPLNTTEQCLIIWRALCTGEIFCAPNNVQCTVSYYQIPVNNMQVLSILFRYVLYQVIDQRRSVPQVGITSMFTRFKYNCTICISPNSLMNSVPDYYLALLTLSTQYT